MVATGVAMGDIIFTTIHGSRLYGLDHADSDYDWFSVTNGSGVKARAHYDPDTKQDSVRMPLKGFLANVQKGSHQSVEAIFSPFKVWNPEFQFLEPMFEAYRVVGGEAASRYRRTIKSFCFGDFKRRRHAARLSLNLENLQLSGRFNPRLCDEDIRYVNTVADAFEGDSLKEVLLGE